MDWDEEKDRHLNVMYLTISEFIDEQIANGTIVPAAITALVQVAKSKAKEHAAIVEDDYFDACLRDILNGGDGLQVGRYRDPE